MDFETVVNRFLLPLLQQYAQSLVTSKFVALLKIQVVLIKMGLSKTTVTILLLLL